MSEYELLQWKFTACQYNIEGSNGFNTFSMSDGLTAEDKAELCRRAGAYTPPEHQVFTPNEEQIRDPALFPVVFSSFPLRSGKRAVVRTVYVGRDYAGMRWGNFFSHALVWPEESWPFYPIQLFESRLFGNGLTKEELQIKAIPPLLPPVTVDAANLRDFSTELPRFFSADSLRPKALTPLLNAVRDGRKSGRPLILKDSRENVPLWLAAVQYAFPLRLAGEITWTTYVHSLSHGERFHITTTSTEDDALRINSPQTTSTNHVFNFKNGGIPEISSKVRIFTGEIKWNKNTYPGTDMQEMQPFLQNLHCDISDDSLDKAVLLYKFVYWNDIPAKPQVMQAVLDYWLLQDLPVKIQLARKILQKNLGEYVEILALLLPRLATVVPVSPKDNELLKLFRVFFIKQFEKIVNEQFTSEYCMRRFEMLDHFLNKNEEIGKALAGDVHRLVTQSGTPHKYAFLYYALILCLYNRNSAVFSENMDFMPVFKEKELELFFDATLDFAVSKAVLPKIHEQIPALYTRHFSGELAGDFVKKYLDRLYSYGLNRVKDGEKAKPQGLAFIKYYLGLPDRQRVVWTFSGIRDLFVLNASSSHENDFIKIEENRKETIFNNMKSQLDSEGWSLNPNETDVLKNNLIEYKTRLEKFCTFIWKWWWVILLVMLLLSFFVLVWLCWNDIIAMFSSWGASIKSWFLGWGNYFFPKTPGSAAPSS
ncbi:MAG: hypothetical protein FWC50_09075 [Planctomycetaceae bacterium]|nr:hypothetical protein [Planctomycetaceae bacterium]